MKRRTFITVGGVALTAGCLSLADDSPPTYDGDGSDIGSQIDAPEDVDEDYCRFTDDHTTDIVEHYSTGFGMQHQVINDVGHDTSGTYGNLPYTQMRESEFDVALDLFDERRQEISEAISGYETASAIAAGCDVPAGDTVVSEAAYGVESCETIDEALSDLEAACEAYVDADADYGDGVPEAQELDERAVSALESVEGRFPTHHDDLRHELTYAE